MQIFASHIQMELQQRGSEYSQLFTKYDHLRPSLLERMPPIETPSTNNANVSELTNGEHTSSPISDEVITVQPEVHHDSVSISYFLQLFSIISYFYNYSPSSLFFYLLQRMAML